MTTSPVAAAGTARAPHTPGAIRKPDFLRSYEQVRDELRDLAARYPQVVSLEDIGDSYEKTAGVADRDILAVRLSSQAGPARKPAAVWIAGVHPTETANPELMMSFVRTLASGYGRDPEVTALLDTRDLRIVPMANPDGHHVVEEGYRTGDKGMMQKRKNTSPPRGTDLNRNWDHNWGTGDGSSPNPGSGKYRGAAPFSEPETRAIAGYVRRVRPDEFIDWHSPGKDILYPWGDTKAEPPHAEGFKRLASRLAAVNGYQYEQASRYSTSQGTSDDYVYGELGIPAITIETGTTSRQHDHELRASWRANEPAMMLAARLADDPFERAAGPEPGPVTITPRRHLVSARVSDADAGGEAIRGAEMYTDPATPAGRGVPMRAADGAFDSPVERVHGGVGDLSGGARSQADGVAGGVDGAGGGQRLVYVRAQDAAGHWGAPRAQWLPAG